MITTILLTLNLAIGLLLSFVATILILAVLLRIIAPVRSFRDLWYYVDLYHTSDYNRYFMMNRRFQDVLCGRKTYGNYIRDEKDMLGPEENAEGKSDFSLKKENSRRWVAYHVLDHEDFIRKHFTKEYFSYGRYLQMRREIDLMDLPRKESSPWSSATGEGGSSDVSAKGYGSKDIGRNGEERKFGDYSGLTDEEKTLQWKKDFWSFFSAQAIKDLGAVDFEKKLSGYIRKNRSGEALAVLYCLLTQKEIIPPGCQHSSYVRALQGLFGDSVTIRNNTFDTALRNLKDNYARKGLIKDLEEDLLGSEPYADSR